MMLGPGYYEAFEPMACNYIPGIACLLAFSLAAAVGCGTDPFADWERQELDNL